MTVIVQPSSCSKLSHVCFVRSAASRYFSKPATWHALLEGGGIILKATSPFDEEKAVVVLRRLWAGSEPVFGGGRRACPLRAWVDDSQGRRKVPSATINAKVYNALLGSDFGPKSG